ncbi:hypothetical protein NDU88_001383 [Pleurodeles waltl]|uniref:Uncharacterized protein n=1 Tax=Pleurodeles waltl TaxID=8319 RepID=A0AAV7V9F7_PLEWA|nr:hypothetical protein NDU88_001383 [Pleurodeles waltl]
MAPGAATRLCWAATRAGVNKEVSGAPLRTGGAPQRKKRPPHASVVGLELAIGAGAGQTRRVCGSRTSTVGCAASTLSIAPLRSVYWTAATLRIRI